MTSPTLGPDAAFDQNTAIVGRVGSGKSFAARGIVEEWLDRNERVCIIDPTGVWYGLRSNAEGNGDGYPVVVFGGDHADVPIAERSGERIAEIIGSRNLPAVIDTSELSNNQRHRFMTDFLGTLYRTNKLPLRLVLDEADDLAPQNPLPENRRMLGDIDKIVRRGRVKGFKVMMITQRPAVLHKNVLSQASTLIAMRLPAPQDRKAIEDWIKGQADIDQAREVLGSLSRLGKGEGWVWAPDLNLLERRQFPLIKTFDSMRTPEHGEIIPAPTRLATVELGDLRALLEEPKAESPVAAGPDRFEEGIAEGRRQTEARYAERLRAYRSAIDGALGFLAPLCKDEGEVGVIDVARQPFVIVDQLNPRPARQRGPTIQFPGDDAPKLHPAARKLLAAAAQHDPARFTWGQLATLAGLKPRGGHFNAGRAELLQRGLVEDSGGTVGPTDAGMTAAGEVPQAPSSPQERLDLWCEKLPQPAPQMLRELAMSPQRFVDVNDLADRLSKQPRGGHWNNGLSLIKTNGLVEVQGRSLRLSELLR